MPDFNDEEIIDDEQLPGDDAEDNEPEFTPEQQAYLERRTQERETAIRAEVRERLQAQGLDYGDGGAAIRDLNTFAARFGFAAGQPEAQQQQQAPTVPTDPFDALGERPDPTYDEDGARDWDRRYRAAIKAEAMAELQPQIQQMQRDIARSHVAAATAHAKQVLTESGFGVVADHPDFETEFSDALIRQPMETWGQPEVLTGVAGFIIPKLKPIQRQQARPRDGDGKFLADANRGTLSQIAPPRETGRAPAGDGTQMDAEERRLAAVMGVTPDEYVFYKQHSDHESHRQFQQRRQQRGGGRR